MKVGASAEWHTLKDILVHEPGIEIFFALLSPSSYLYERFFNRRDALIEHRNLCRMIREDFGVRVHYLGEVIEQEAVRDQEILAGLVGIAAKRLERHCRGEICNLPERIQAEMVNPLPLSERDPGHLFDIARLNPVLVHRTGGIEVKLGRPLHNLYFMRDQHAATDIGLVSGRMATIERQDEVDLCSLGIRATGAEIAGAIHTGTFEGGNFIPAGQFALLGWGSRTTLQGVSEFLKCGLNFDEVAVVREPVHPLIRGNDPMVSMHLDTFFNIPGEGLAVGCRPLLEAAAVKVFHRKDGGYEPAGDQTDLVSYISDKGFELIEITTLEQLCYASNFLCVRDGECIVPDTAKVAPVIIERWREKTEQNPQKYAALLAQAELEYTRLSLDDGFFPNKKIVKERGLTMTPVTLTNATGGYGGAHCMTCVISR
jgi:arginine deiminase